MTTKLDAGTPPPAADWVDPDEAPVLTDEFFADAEVFQGETFVRRGRGRPPTGNAKEQVSVRLDRDVLAALRQAGPGWQSRVNGILRTALQLDAVRGAGGVGPVRQSVTFTGAGGPVIVELRDPPQDDDDRPFMERVLTPREG